MTVDAQGQWLLDMEAVMKTREGRRVLHTVIANTGLRRESFVEASDRKSAYKEGRRSVGMGLDQEIQLICPELWVLMEREFLDDAEVRVQILRSKEDSESDS